LKQTLEAQVADVLAPKRLLLWKTLMGESGYHDKAIFDMICGGIRIRCMGSMTFPMRVLRIGDLQHLQRTNFLTQLFGDERLFRVLALIWMSNNRKIFMMRVLQKSTKDIFLDP